MRNSDLAFMYRDTSVNDSSTVAEYDAMATYEWLAVNRWRMYAANALYIFSILYGRRIISRLAFSDLFVHDLTLIWNSCNAIFNAYCAIALLPDFMRSASKGWYHVICRTDGLYIDGWSGRALSLFFMSKNWEFGDTILLIMRGRKVMFLHAYHHVIVLVQVSISYGNAGAAVRLGVLMNCMALAVMYAYFAAVNVKPALRRYAAVVTLLQLTQFFVGIFALISALLYRFADHFGDDDERLECETNVWALLFNLTAYSTFAFLFCEYFRRCYLERRQRVAAGIRYSTTTNVRSSRTSVRQRNFYRKN